MDFAGQFTLPISFVLSNVAHDHSLTLHNYLSDACFDVFYQLKGSFELGDESLEIAGLPDLFVLCLEDAVSGGSEPSDSADDLFSPALEILDLVKMTVNCLTHAFVAQISVVKTICFGAEVDCFSLMKQTSLLDSFWEVIELLGECWSLHVLDDLCIY